MDREIARKLLEVDNLPTLPAVMNRLLDAVEDDNSSAQDVTEILERDLAISARILRLANSAFYGLRYKVDTIRRAVVVVGFEAVRMLALATSVFDTLSKHQQFAFDPMDFWLHSLGTAKGAQILSGHVKGGIESPESCFTSGLLLDIGKYCLALALKREYRDVVEEAERQGCHLHMVEREVLNTTNALAGMWVAEKWRLPPSISDVIGNQHRLTTYTGPYKTETAMMVLASEMSRAADFGNGGDFGPPNLNPSHLAVSGIDVKAVEAMVEELKQYRQEAQRFLESMKS